VDPARIAEKNRSCREQRAQVIRAGNGALEPSQPRALGQQAGADPSSDGDDGIGLRQPALDLVGEVAILRRGGMDPELDLRKGR